MGWRNPKRRPTPHSKEAELNDLSKGLLRRDGSTDRFRDGLLGFDGFGHRNRQLRLFCEGGFGRIQHAFRPYVKTASLGCEIAAARDFPGSPDAFAFVEALIIDVVLGQVTLGEMALAVGQVILASDDEFAD